MVEPGPKRLELASQELKAELARLQARVAQACDALGAVPGAAPRSEASAPSQGPIQPDVEGIEAAGGSDASPASSADDLAALLQIGPALAYRLELLGIRKPADLHAVTPDDLSARLGPMVSGETVQEWIERIKALKGDPAS